MWKVGDRAVFTSVPGVRPEFRGLECVISGPYGEYRNVADDGVVKGYLVEGGELPPPPTDTMGYCARPEHLRPPAWRDGDPRELSQWLDGPFKPALTEREYIAWVTSG
jgi:hypothetical protein